MKTKILILLSLIIVIGLSILMRDLPFSFTSAKDEDFARPEICLGSAIALYHKSLNDLFNSKVDLLTSGKPKTFVDVLPEVDINTGLRKPCQSNNVTTFCVARKSLEKYEAFLKIMKHHQDRVSDGVSVTISLDEAGVAYANRQKLIGVEIENARKTLDTSLAMYHEFRAAYPIHKKFEKTFSLLEKYRDGVANIRRLMRLYQFKFIDVTTTKCV